jgi:hypothetical protein
MAITDYTSFGLNSKSFGRAAGSDGCLGTGNNRFDFFHTSFVWIVLVEIHQASGFSAILRPIGNCC